LTKYAELTEKAAEKSNNYFHDNQHRMNDFQLERVLTEENIYTSVADDLRRMLNESEPNLPSCPFAKETS